MKKTVITVLSIVSVAALIILLSIFSRTYIIPVLNIGSSQTGNRETFLTETRSPDGKYDLEAYRTEPGATVDFSIKVYIINGDQ